VVDRQGESRGLGVNEEEASGNPSGLAATIFRAAFRSRIYVSNRETYPALTRALQKGGVHTRPHMPFDDGEPIQSVQPGEDQIPFDFVFAKGAEGF
jgi:hypothetical protein